MSIPGQQSLSTLACLSLALLAVSVPVVAADITDGIASTAREFARQQQEAKQKLFRRELPTQEPATVAVRLGLTHVDGDAGSSRVQLPFEFSYQTAHTEGSIVWWKYLVGGDGHVWARDPGTVRRDGFADLSLTVVRPFATSWMGAATLTLPSRGDIGSRHAWQTAKLVYTHAWIDTVLSSQLIGALSHFNASIPGASDLSHFLYGSMNYTLDGGSKLITHLARSHRQGASASTRIGVEFEFELTKEMDAAFVLRRVFSGTSRSTTVQVNLIHQF